jgi:hypothetical protein
MSVFVTNQKVGDSMDKRLTHIKARNALDEIAGNAKIVYQEGEGALFNIYVDLPQGINHTRVAGTSIQIGLISEDDTVVFKNMPFEVAGEIPTAQGIHQIRIESQGTVVAIGYAMLRYYPYYFTETLAAGASVDRNLEIGNLIDNEISVGLSYVGSSSINVTFNETSPFTIYENKMENVGLTIGIEGGTPSGDYSGHILIEGEDQLTSTFRNYTVPIDVAVT